jgi:hypothetical protein
MAEALRALAGDRCAGGAWGWARELLAEEVFDRDKLAAEYLAVLLRQGVVAKRSRHETNAGCDGGAADGGGMGAAAGVGDGGRSGRRWAADFFLCRNGREGTDGHSGW